MAPYAYTIFLSAFILFQIQPLMGRYILPWFGGTPGVWTTCLLFFQTVLLAGYLYAHALSTHVSPRRQRIVHWLLLAAALLFLPIIPDPAVWRPHPGDSPVLRILLLLTCTVGLPLLTVSSTGPLLQRWFADRFPGRSPYRLYALSNLASILGLVTYPILIEPFVRLRAQGWLWSALYVAFAAGCAICAHQSRFGAAPSTDDSRSSSSHPILATGASPTAGLQLFWILLAACSSAHLMAATNQLCQDVVSIPLLWILPLTLYLLTFIVAFDSPGSARIANIARLIIIVLVFALALAKGFASIWVQIGFYSLILWSCCYLCHSELARLKPSPAHLTRFYLAISIGGALGGVFVAILAPLLFPNYWEYPITLVGVMFLAIAASWRADDWNAPARVKRLARSALLGLTFGVSLMIFYFFGVVTLPLPLANMMKLPPNAHPEVASYRNFYGVLRLRRMTGGSGEYLQLSHGVTVHGIEFADPEKKYWPTTYYGPHSGAAYALNEHPRRHNSDPSRTTLKVALVGLGIGTLTSYGQAGDLFRFYEINPMVVEVANRDFAFTSHTKAHYETILGDARITLEREPVAGPGPYDVIIVDAFSSDSIPVHLLTLECGKLYLRHLADGGILAFHVSNRHLELRPVVRALAQQLGLEAVDIYSAADPAHGKFETDWVVLTNNRAWLENPAVCAAITPWPQTAPAPLLWTDDFSSLWSIIKY